MKTNILSGAPRSPPPHRVTRLSTPTATQPLSATPTIVCYITIAVVGVIIVVIIVVVLILLRRGRR
uniref:Uncharacterized protein n=1 Tax=Ignisphaera aggregans TaxID=334771 RepID=A0A7J3ZAP8_9CREN